MHSCQFYWFIHSIESCWWLVKWTRGCCKHVLHLCHIIHMVFQDTTVPKPHWNPWLSLLILSNFLSVFKILLISPYYISMSFFHSISHSHSSTLLKCQSSDYGKFSKIQCWKNLGTKCLVGCIKVFCDPSGSGSKGTSQDVGAIVLLWLQLMFFKKSK